MGQWQEKGNEYVKMGKIHYKEAVDCYTRAIDQKSSDPLHNSICYSNRAHVELLLGNNRRAYSDAQEAIKANPANIKVGLVSWFLEKLFAVLFSLLFMLWDWTWSIWDFPTITNQGPLYKQSSYVLWCCLIMSVMTEFYQANPCLNGK